MSPKGPKAPTGGKNGRLDEEDLGLWRRVTESATPLSGRRQLRPPDTGGAESVDSKAPESDATGSPPAKAVPKPAAKRPAPRPRGPQPPEPWDKTKPLTPGTLHDIDKRTAGRLKRGKLPVEARLDLHGMTQAQAERALGRFLAESQAAGLRNVLLITGKGREKPGAMGEAAGGVLRREVPRWINHPRNRDRVVAVTPAQPKDGGEGALYLRLKRVRGRD